MPYLEISKALLWTLWYENIDLAMKDISNKLMIFINGRKKRWKKVMSVENQGLQHREGERWK